MIRSLAILLAAFTLMTVVVTSQAFADNIRVDGPNDCKAASTSCRPAVDADDAFNAAACPIVRRMCKAYREGDEAAYNEADEELRRVNAIYAAGGLRDPAPIQPQINFDSYGGGSNNGSGYGGFH